MKIELYEPELIQRRGFNGFFRYFLQALVDHAGAQPVEDPRPLPRVTVPRQHESAWARFDGDLVFFDMSDHVHLIDIEALRICRAYFKANLCRSIVRRILSERNLEEHEKKFVPFTFFSDGLDDFFRDARRRAFFFRDRPLYDICFVMGVYVNPILQGERSPFEDPAIPMTPSSCHFWIRWHLQDGMKRAGIKGIYRLTSRANPAIEDGVHVFSNWSRRRFSRAMTRGRMTAVCTLPHAIFPWKVSESFALGRPILLDCEPMTEIPDRFRPQEGVHYLSLLGKLPGPETSLPWEDPRAYRILPRITTREIHEAIEKIRPILEDKKHLAEMGRSARRFAETAYRPEHVAEYICDAYSAIAAGN